MNVENIAGLTSILFKAGFENLSYRLLQHICCKPVRFALSETLQQQASRLSCLLFFERKGTDYVFTHYEAALLKDHPMPVLIINQVALQELERRMEAIDWKLTPPGVVFRLNDASTWEREKNIELVMNDLARMSAVEEGKAYADILKVKFWSGKTMEEMVGGLAAIRGRLEVSQRFYVVDGECINVEEALRFLQNKWMEKRILALRKHSPAVESSRDAGGRNDKLLKKRRVGRSRKIV